MAPRTGDSDWRPFAIVRRGGLALVLEIVSSLFTVGLVVVIERSLPDGSLGTYGVASSLGLLLYFGGSLGTSSIIMREATARPKDFRALSSASLWFRLAFIAAVSAPTVLLAPSAAFGLFMLNTAGNLLVDLGTTVLRGNERYAAAGVVNLLCRALMLAVVLAAAPSNDLTVVALALTFATLVSGLTCIWWAFSQAGIGATKHPLRVLVRTLRGYSREATMLNASAAAYSATSRLDVAIVGVIAGIGASSGYVAAAVLGGGLSNMTQTLVGFVLPRLSATPARDVAKEARRIASVTFAGATVCAAGGVLIADPVIDLLYGSGRGLGAAPSILRILILAFPFAVGARVLLAGFIAVARPVPVLVSQLIDTAWLVGAIVVGYELSGLHGAAVGSASSDVVMLALALLCWRVYRRGGSRRSTSTA